MATLSRNQLNVKNFKVDMRELFDSIKKLLEDLDYDVIDKAYKYQGKPEEIKEVQFNIYGDKKVDNYSKFVINVEVNVKKAKFIAERGKKLLTGDGKIIFTCELVLDYDEKWSKDPILHFLKKIYERYIYKPLISKYETTLAKEMFSIRDDVKSIVGMSD